MNRRKILILSKKNDSCTAPLVELGSRTSTFFNLVLFMAASEIIPLPRIPLPPGARRGTSSVQHPPSFARVTVNDSYRVTFNGSDYEEDMDDSERDDKANDSNWKEDAKSQQEPSKLVSSEVGKRTSSEHASELGEEELSAGSAETFQSEHASERGEGEQDSEHS